MQAIENITRPTIVFGDIHGLTCWKEIVNENPDYRYIFLGDYFDPYQFIDSKLLFENLQEIMQLKKDRSDDVILLLGNHDLHYFSSDMPVSNRLDLRIAGRVANMFLENIRLFMYAFQEGNTIITHAGISEKWFHEDFKGDTEKNIAKQLNCPSQEQVQAMCRCGERRGGASNTVGGIFWADISELEEPLRGYTQIVGHNRVDDIREHTNNGGRIIFCDCLCYGKYLKM
jgi:hypothetical protein